MRMFGRIHQDHPVLIEQLRVAFHLDSVVSLVPKTQPGAAVGQRVGSHPDRGVQGCPHAGAGLSIPPPAGLQRINRSDFPQGPLFFMSAAFISARDKCCLDLGNSFERCVGLPQASNACGIVRRPNNHKIVGHDIVAFYPPTRSDKGLLLGPGMYQQHIAIAVASVLERLTRPDRDHAHLDSCLGPKTGQYGVKQAGVLG